MGKSAFKKILRADKKSGYMTDKPWETRSMSNAEDKESAKTRNETHDESRGGAVVMKESGCLDGKETQADGIVERVEAKGELKKEDASAKGLKIYRDASVCRALNIRRKILKDSRTSCSRGKDWDSKGEEVGMTMEWIARFAEVHNIVPNFFGDGGLEEADGSYVSVFLIGTTPNMCIVQVECEATGRKEFARTRNQKVYPIHIGEPFSCDRITSDGHLEWVFAPNNARY